MAAVRSDLAEAHDAGWAELGRPGAWWTGAQRVELARTVLLALDDDDVLAPWVPVTSADRPIVVEHAPGEAHDLAYRIARHAGTLTEDIARSSIDTLGALPYVELCALVSTVAAIAHFDRSAGLTRRPLPGPVDGDPTREQPASIEPAASNWVPVEAPADRLPAVVQAYSAVPPADRTTWRMSDAQYMPGDQMVDPHWRRRPDGLSRPETELIASRVALLRECFY